MAELKEQVESGENQSTDEDDEKSFAEGFDNKQPEAKSGKPPEGEGQGGKGAEDGGGEKPKQDEAAARSTTDEKKGEEKNPDDEPVTITKGQLALLLGTLEDNKKFKASFDKLNGTLGAQKQQIDSLIKAGQPTPQEITDQDFEDLSKEFPEIASAVRKSMNRVLKNLRGGAAPSKADEEAVKKMIADATLAREAELLEEEFEDWRDIVGKKEDSSNPYRVWLKGQPKTYQEKINSTYSGAIISSSIRKFKAATKRAEDEQKEKDAAEQARLAEEKRRKATEERQRTLRAGVTPRGDGGRQSGGSQPTDDEQFEAGFKSG